MNWNPLRKKTIARQISSAGLVGDLENDFEKNLKALKHLEESSKKFHQDVKKCTEYLAELAKAEQKLTTNLSLSSLCHNDEKLRILTEEYHSITKAMDPNVNELILVSQRAVLDPLKKYNNIFNHLTTALKKRDQLMQECQKCQSKLEKFQEKEKTGPNLAKIAHIKKQLTQAQDELSEHSSQLAKDVPLFYKNRISYFHPCFEAYVRGHVENCGRNTQLFAEIANSISQTSLQRDDEQIQQKLSEIKALSIVAD